jgi:hypothetical protein
MTDYRVSVGDWTRAEVYKGENLWLAGLNAARAERDRHGWYCGGNVSVADLDNYDGEGSGLEEEQDEFIEACIDAGSGFKRRKPVVRTPANPETAQSVIDLFQALKEALQK